MPIRSSIISIGRGFVNLRNYLNAVLNELSETFSDGQLAKDLGLPTVTRQYLICLTNEADGAVRTRKLRIMVIQKHLLTNLPDQMPTLESPHHQTLWETLSHLAEARDKLPHYFFEIELVVPGSKMQKGKLLNLRLIVLEPD